MAINKYAKYNSVSVNIDKEGLGKNNDPPPSSILSPTKIIPFTV